MDVNLLIVVVSSIIFVTAILLLLFSVDFKRINNFRFFKNEKYHHLTYFILLGIIIFLVITNLFQESSLENIRHVILVALLLIIFRRGAVER